MLDMEEWEQINAGLDTMENVIVNGTPCVPINSVKYLLQKWAEDHYIPEGHGKVLSLVKPTESNPDEV